MLHKNHKLYKICKNVPVWKNDDIDFLSFQITGKTTLRDIIKECAKKHPHSNVTYEVINIRENDFMNEHRKKWVERGYLCDIRIIYQPDPVAQVHADIQSEEVLEVNYTSNHRPYITGSHREIKKISISSKPTKIDYGWKYKKYLINEDFGVCGTNFTGHNLDECVTFIDYVVKAPECYKNRAIYYCPSLADLELKTDFGGECKLVERTTAKYKPMVFHSRMAQGNRYQY